MDFNLSEDQEFFRQTVQKFLASEVPLETVRQLAESKNGFDDGWWRQGAELGLTALLVPEEQGGMSLAGEGLLDLAMLAEEMGRLVSPGPLLATSVFAAAIAEFGTEEQKNTFLPQVVAGDLKGSWALYETGGRWQPNDIDLQAVPLGSGDGYILNGVKAPVEAACEAGCFLVTAHTPDGLTQFLVPATAEGLSVKAMESLDLVRRFGELHFENVEVSADAVLGKPGAAAADFERLLQIAVALQCAETSGSVARVLEFTLEYAFDRYSFGRPLASYQAIKHRFADMKLWSEACMAAATGAAKAVQHKTDDAALIVSSAKSYIGDHATSIIQDCVQLHGGIGVTWEHNIHLYLRRATCNQVQYGTPAEHRERLASMIGMDED